MSNEVTSENVTDNEASGFLSYARSDDENENGRISELRERLSAEVQMQTGKVFPIFQDREDISTGRRWWSSIEESIVSTRLLIAIITPSFLRSETCRREVRLFANREQVLNCDELIVPILYVQTPQLYDLDDDIAGDLIQRNYFDWVDLRFEDSDTNTYRKGIASLAGQIIAAIEQSTVGSSSVVTIGESQDGVAAPDDDADGFIEALAGAEEALPQFVESIESFTVQLYAVTAIVDQATKEITKAKTSGKPSSAILAITIRLSGRLEKPVQAMDELADAYVEHLERVDNGVNAMIERLSMTSSDQDQETARGLLDALRDLCNNAGSAFDSMEDSRQAIVNNYSLSSNLRTILKRMSTSMLRIMRSRPMFERWRDDLAGVLGNDTR